MVVLLFTASTLFGQTKKNEKPMATPTPAAEVPVKRNGRPDANDAGNAAPLSNPATHFYEFSRPGFNYGHVIIEHDDTGKGKISFMKDGFDDLETDPIDLSGVTMAKIGEALAELKFLDSTEEYQHARDFTHMGDVTFTLRRDGRSRTVKYNWTENKAAKALMDEYRRITNEYTWRFDLAIAIRNYPLQTPGLMELLDGYMKRGEISDPGHLVPFLTGLSNDERMPLMARNRASKIIKDIEKQKK